MGPTSKNINLMLVVAGVWAGGADGSARARGGSREAAGGIL